MAQIKLRAVAERGRAAIEASRAEWSPPTDSEAGAGPSTASTLDAGQQRIMGTAATAGRVSDESPTPT
jgi:hypothetical protein